jgi:hypothetical protein
VSAALRRTVLPQPFDFDVFAAGVAATTGLAVRIEASDSLPPFVAGRWYRGPDEDVIAYDSGLSELGRIGTVLHEAGHILCGHSGADDIVNYDAALCSVLNTEAMANFSHVRYRSVYRTRYEREAESYARTALALLMSTEEGTDVAARVRLALGHPRLRMW